MGVYRKLKSDGSWDWYIDYRFQGRRLRERIGPNKAQARTVLQKRRVEMAEGKFLEKRRESKTTLAEMAKLYLDKFPTVELHSIGYAMNVAIRAADILEK